MGLLFNSYRQSPSDHASYSLLQRRAKIKLEEKIKLEFLIKYLLKDVVKLWKPKGCCQTMEDHRGQFDAENCY